MNALICLVIVTYWWAAWEKFKKISVSRRNPSTSFPTWKSHNNKISSRADPLPPDIRSLQCSWRWSLPGQSWFGVFGGFWGEMSEQGTVWPTVLSFAGAMAACGLAMYFVSKMSEGPIEEVEEEEDLLQGIEEDEEVLIA